MTDQAEKAVIEPGAAPAVFWASNISVGTCDSCPGLHINLHNAAGDVIATAVVGLQVVPLLVVDIAIKLERAKRGAGAGSTLQ